MNAPRATARLQLHAGFTLDDARACVDYYADLGTSHLYLSPITRARAGSTHGYDVIDHGAVNPELGGEPALERLARAARRRGLGLIADIVPNHMAADPANAWWRDVLALGQASAYSRHFDIDWHAPDAALRGKILLPVLADPYGDALARGDIRLRLGPGDGSFELDTPAGRYPVASSSIPRGYGGQALLRLHDPCAPDGRERLHGLLERQHYRLAWWRTAPDQINWRRFFEISELVGVRVEDDAVFDDVHALVLRLYAEGILDGLRIDHIDGLASPGAYLRRLAQRLAQAGACRPAACAQKQAYLVVEKILAPGEEPDPRWRMDGTTGYDFMDQAGALLHAPAAEGPLRAFWQALTGDTRAPRAQLEAARRRMLERHFPSERLALVRSLERVARQDARTRDWTAHAIDRALSAMLTAFPVYRSYAEDGGRGRADREACRKAMQRAADLLEARAGSADAALLAELDQWLSGEAPPGLEPQALAERSEALRRFQQLTPPLAAKALEDTLLYRYGPLLSRNEVGASPDTFALSPSAFHALAEARARTHPRAMLATATHDHKRGEDARARLAALSEMPGQWRDNALRWIQALPAGDAPTLADRYLLIQTLVGAWPADWDAGLAAQPDSALAQWLERVSQWQRKALREAKLHTSWTDPDPAYETAADAQIAFLLDDPAGRGLLGDIAAFASELAPAGMINSLTQTLLRNTLPGVPDLYQGTELWDFSLVDPDNRRPVDYARREALLARAREASAIDLSESAWRSGAVKQALIQRLLAARTRLPALFAEGECIALAARGAQAERVLAWLRRHDGQNALVVAPHLCALSLAGYARGCSADARSLWADTVLALPAEMAGGAWRDATDGRQLHLLPDGSVPLAEILREMPVALCLSVDG
ncbi:malto-oligosyltrehalose synthase [Achromobacter sp. RTa]|uniref:malto-oligosyltrehalose synthase n=1 Tax=Achromobacter sp. RTa TaxID=1532557 RepID=UPI00050DB2C6|nr:malto-oligosyltrehalose synthase [Achromobacter sp. RTa]KGD86900.1 malto-oligosyltrehalose synthase [Achromobacter sp. RTa]